MPLLSRHTLLTCGLLTIFPAAVSAAPIAADTTVLLGAATSGAATPLATPVQSSDLGATSVSADGRFVAFASHADGLSTENNDAFAGIYVKDRQTGAVEFVSRRTGTTGAPNPNGCAEPSISNDGQRVAFECSGALAPTDTNASTDIYVRDRGAATTTLVSAGVSGVGNGSSDSPVISGNGAYVAFGSYSTNLVTGAPSTGFHVYRRLLGGANTVELVDKPAGGALPNDEAREASISADGSRIAFSSSATNLVAGVNDTNGYPDVYWRAMASPGVSGLVSSVNGNTFATGNASAGAPSISGNGSYVAFESGSTNLGDGDTDVQQDIHRRTLGTPAVVLVSRATGAAGAKANAYSSRPRSDASGDAVLFLTAAANLAGAGSETQSFLRRIGAGTTELVSRSAGAAGAASTSGASNHALAPNGNVSAFEAVGVTPDADVIAQGVFVRDLSLAARPTTLVSRPPGTEPFINLGGSARIAGPGSVSADGRFTVFSSAAAGLPGAVPGGIRQVWRKDALTGDVVLVSRASGVAGAISDDNSGEARISADGNRVVFLSGAGNFGLGASSSGTATYVRDLTAGSTTLVSRATGAGAVALYSDAPAISGDGNRVAFLTDDPALGVVGSKDRLFVRDLTAGTTTPIGSALPGEFAAPALDADGSRVAFELILPMPGGEGFGSEITHVWWSDVDGGAPTRLDPTALDDDDSTAPTISADGNRIAFSAEGALVPTDLGIQTDVYVRDLTSGAFTLVSATIDGTAPTGGSYSSQISADGRKVAFESDAGNVVATPVGTDSNVFVRDLGAGTTVHASRGDGASGALLDEDVLNLAVSGDGGCVVFDTTATTLGTGLTTANTRVWLRAVSGTCPAAPLPVTPTPSPTPSSTPGPVGEGVAKPAAPRLSSVKATRTSFVTKGKKAGTLITFTLDQAARVDAVLARSTKGHLVGKACKKGAAKKRLKQKPCARLAPAATLQVRANAGAGKLAITGKAKRKRLPKGKYVLTLTATGPGGTSAPVALKLTIR